MGQNEKAEIKNCTICGEDFQVIYDIKGNIKNKVKVYKEIIKGKEIECWECEKCRED